MQRSAFCILALAAGMGILSATPATAVNAELVSAGNPLTDSHGYYVGPYTLNVNGIDYAAMCIDFADHATVGQHYSAYETQVSSGSFAATYHPTWEKQYEEEAYLLSLIEMPNADRINIQHAAWGITDSQYKVNSAAQQYIDLALANYQSIDFSQFDIISGVNGTDRAQEFMINPKSVATATPEPATILLMGIGLLIAGLARRKIIKKA